VKVSHDITESIRLEEELRQAQKMEAIGRLAGGIAHDFNNLLAAMSGNVELMRIELPDDHQVRPSVEEVGRGIDRAADLTGQLLAFSRKATVKPAVLDLSNVVTEMDRMLRRIIGEQIEVVTRLRPEPCHIRADRGHLEQIVLNLAINARDAMPAGGSLTIETSAVTLDDGDLASHPGLAAGPHAMLTVSDTGLGMDEETRARLFEPFFSTKGDKGTGLGLATVYGIARQHGGAIIVRSEAGRGSTFSVYFPLVDDPLTVERATRHTILLGEDNTILVLDDETSVLNVATQLLEQYGYKVLRADSGIKAVDLFNERADEIDLLLTDVVLPDMSGKQVADKLHETRPDLPVLYTSGYTDEAVIKHGVLPDDVPFIAKPYHSVDLLERIRELICGPEG